MQCSAIVPSCLPHTVYCQSVAYTANDHFMTFDVVYHGNGKANFDLKYRSKPGYNKQNVSFQNLTIEEVSLIADQAYGVHGRLTILPNTEYPGVTLKLQCNNAKQETMSITDENFVQLRLQIWKDLYDYDTMSMYTNQCDGAIAVKNPEAQRVLALACLRDAYDKEILRIMDQIEQDEKREDEQIKKIDDIRHKAVIINQLNILNTEHVNKFLRFSSCQIECEKPLEPLGKSLLNNRAAAIKETLYTSGSPSVRYFIRLLRFNESIEERGVPLCGQN